jgi:hypothetical protein
MSSATEPDLVWFVKAEERVFGPFSEDRLPLFVAEGRLSTRTLVSNALEGPFAPAGQAPGLVSLFEALDAADPFRFAEDEGLAGPAPVSAPAEARGGEAITPALAPLRGPIATSPGPAFLVGHDLPGASFSAAERPPQCALLVLAVIESLSGEEVRARLERYGPVEALGAEAFLIDAPLSAALLRTSLTRGLGPRDLLLVLEVRPEGAAWFNLPAGAERRLLGL